MRDSRSTTERLPAGTTRSPSSQLSRAPGGAAPRALTSSLLLGCALAALSCSSEGAYAPSADPVAPRPAPSSTVPAAAPERSVVPVAPQPSLVPLAPTSQDDEGLGDVSLEMLDEPATAVPPSRVTVVVLEPPGRPAVDCAPLDNPGALDDADINVDLSTQFQRISGFGGMNQPRWIADLTPEQALVAFGDAPGQLGLSLLRMAISANPEDFILEVPTAQRAVALGARVFATPWTPPPSLKSNASNIGGELPPENYGAYADHLLAFRNVLAENGVPLTAISVQNEPDISVNYDSCDWTAAQIGDFLKEQGPRFGDTRLIAAESFNFNRMLTDPLLNDAAAAAEFEIVGGHIYGRGLADYPLARERGKEVWMTEHYTDSGAEPDRANLWPLAFNVATELQRSMQANFNAYVWWYIRRGYGLITDDGLVSKRGYLMSQFSRFIRPGYVRVAASNPALEGVDVTAYSNGPDSVVVVVLNTTDVAQTVALDLFGSCVVGFDRFTTSQVKNAQNDGPVALIGGRVSVTLDPRSVTSFVSQPIVAAAN